MGDSKMEEIARRTLKDVARRRRDIRAAEDDRVFNLWQAKYKWEGLYKDQAEYVMRKLWKVGSLCSYKAKGAPEGAPEGMDSAFVCFAQFAAEGWNMYNFPTAIRVTPERTDAKGAYYPARVLRRGTDCAIGYALHNLKPVYSLVRVLIEQITDVEMTIENNLLLQKTAGAVIVTPESKMKADDMLSKLIRDFPVVYVDADSAGALSNLGFNVPFIVPDLYAYKNELENEIYTLLGIDNMGALQKRERLVIDEANSNNVLINAYGDAIYENISAFVDETNKLFGTSIKVEPAYQPAEAISEEDGKSGVEEGEEGESYDTAI